MSKFHVLAKVTKPYALKDGDVVTAQPGRVLIVEDANDSSDSIVKGLRDGDLQVVPAEAAPGVKRKAAHGSEALKAKAVAMSGVKAPVTVAPAPPPPMTFPVAAVDASKDTEKESPKGGKKLKSKED